MLDWDTLRWVNCGLAFLVVVLLVSGTMHRWHVMPARLKRIVPWVIATYVVIAYGSGELAASNQDVSPGLRVMALTVVLLGLLVALSYRFGNDDYSDF